MRTIYFLLDNEGYLTGISSNSYRDDDEIKLEVEEDHEIFTSDAMVFKYENGELTKDEERQKQLLDEQSKPSDEQMNAIALMELTELIMGGK